MADFGECYPGWLHRKCFKEAYGVDPGPVVFASTEEAAAARRALRDDWCRAMERRDTKKKTVDLAREDAKLWAPLLERFP